MGDGLIYKCSKAKRWSWLEVFSKTEVVVRKGSLLNPLPTLVLGVLLSISGFLFSIAWFLGRRKGQKEKGLTYI